MKTICLLILSICFSCASFAQLKKGNTRLGAQIANLNYEVASKTLTISLNSSFSYFVSDRILIGGQLSFSSNAELGKVGGRNNFRAIGFGPSSRQYLQKSLRGGFFFEETISFNFLNRRGIDNSALGFSFSPGYSFVLNKAVSFDIGLGWIGYFDIENSNLSDNIGLNLGLSIYLGNKDKTDNK